MLTLTCSSQNRYQDSRRHQNKIAMGTAQYSMRNLMLYRVMSSPLSLSRSNIFQAEAGSAVYSLEWKADGFVARASFSSIKFCRRSSVVYHRVAAAPLFLSCIVHRVAPAQDRDQLSCCILNILWNTHDFLLGLATDLLQRLRPFSDRIAWRVPYTFALAFAWSMCMHRVG